MNTDLFSMASQAAVSRPTPIYLSDFMTGTLAALAKRGVNELLNKQNRLDSVFEKLFAEVEKNASSLNLDLRFYVQTHPQHGDSEDVQQELTSAARRDLISLDNPEFQVVRFKIKPGDASQYLDELPGPSGLYDQLAKQFMELYLEAIQS